MKEKLSNLIMEKVIRRLYLSCFLINILQAVLILLLLNRLPVVVPLFYSLTWGEQQLVPSYFLFIFPLSLFFLLLVNILISIFTLDVESKDFFLARLLAIFTLFINFIAFFALGEILGLFI